MTKIEPELAELEAKLEKLEFKWYVCWRSRRVRLLHRFTVRLGQCRSSRLDFNDIARICLRWKTEEFERRFKTEVIEVSDGDVAGLKGATVRISGEYAYGWLRTETGVHRLVRKSPFDSKYLIVILHLHLRLSAEIDDNITIDNPSDLRIDVCRASGAGGQHVNTTESAVRITHVPA